MFSNFSTLVVFAAGDIGAKYALGLPGLGILMLGPTELPKRHELLIRILQFIYGFITDIA